jgi:hypothetical protein
MLHKMDDIFVHIKEAIGIIDNENNYNMFYAKRWVNVQMWLLWK